MSDLVGHPRGETTTGAAREEDARSDGMPHIQCGGIHEVDAETFAKLLAEIDASKAARAEKMPDEQAALAQMHEAWTRLKEMGWAEAIYCPKDGTPFDAIEAGSTGIHDCHYEGAWPKGRWWVAEAGDLWPSRPILYRLRAPEAKATGPLARTDASQAPGTNP